MPGQRNIRFCDTTNTRMKNLNSDFCAFWVSLFKDPMMASTDPCTSPLIRTGRGFSCCPQPWRRPECPRTICPDGLLTRRLMLFHVFCGYDIRPLHALCFLIQQHLEISPNPGSLSQALQQVVRYGLIQRFSMIIKEHARDPIQTSQQYIALFQRPALNKDCCHRPASNFHFGFHHRTNGSARLGRLNSSTSA